VTCARWPFEDGDGEFVVEARRSGVRCVVRTGETIAEALEAAGVHPSLQCESGVCGTCVTPVLDGLPDHRDDFQTDEEHASNTLVNVCCSRSSTDAPPARGVGGRRFVDARAGQADGATGLVPLFERSDLRMCPEKSVEVMSSGLKSPESSETA
jgi:ferredoxin